MKIFDIVNESYNPEYDDEAGMADNNLETLKRAVEGLDNLIGAGDNLPEWCQEKIAVAKSMLVAVWDYMESEESNGVSESATAGATSTANIGTVINPHISPGKARGKKSYLGDPWGGKSGTKSPPQPKVVQPKNKDGTAKGAHQIKGASLFGGPTIKRR